MINAILKIKLAFLGKNVCLRLCALQLGLGDNTTSPLQIALGWELGQTL